MRQGEPRFCVGCGVNRRAKRHGVHCHACMPGGPFVPPPCRRCGTTENFFATGLCARCHFYGTTRIDACPDCHAWGTTRRGGWTCRGCGHWRHLHRTVSTCHSCTHVRPVNDRGICRLCWRNAKGHRDSRGEFDPIGGNRAGQQLFFADMQKAAIQRRHEPAPPEPTVWPSGRPVAHRQQVMFHVPVDFSRGRLPLPQPRDLELAAALDAVAVAHGHRRGWTRTTTSKVRAGIRILLGLQDTPGAPIRSSETVGLSRLLITVRPVIEVLETVDMFEDDRRPTIGRWFADRTVGLPAPMQSELDVWFDVMINGSRTAPRRKPRSGTTLRIYVGAVMPGLRRWAENGHQSLREITRAQVLDVLPSDSSQRKMCGQAMRSIFGVLKNHKLVFANPAVRLAHTADLPLVSGPVDLDAVRDALNSTDSARATLAALTAYHGLRSHQLRNLRLTDIRDRQLRLDGRRIPLADPVRRRIAAWLDDRNRRWPMSTNPHLFIHFRTAHHDHPVGIRWVFLTLALPGGVQALRADRILHEAIASGGDARRLCDLFGLSIQHAARYTHAIAEPTLEC